MRLVMKLLMAAAGLALAYYPLMMFLFFLLIQYDEVTREAPAQWRDLWKVKADATVTEVRTRCSIREIHREGARRRNVNVVVPCDRIEDERAARSVETQKLSPVEEVVVTFTTEDGRQVEAVSYSGILKLADPVQPGQKVRISYDRKEPTKTPHAARGTSSLFISAAMLILMAWGLRSAWRAAKRHIASLAARIRSPRHSDVAND